MSERRFGMADDLEKLQGTWLVTSLETDGNKMEMTAFGDARIVIKGNRFVSEGMGAVYKGAVEVSEAKGLKTFDLLFSAGPQKGTRNLGIYRLQGDRWTICLATSGGKRPGAFATKAGSGFALETLEREGARKTGKAVSSSKASAVRSAKAAKPETDVPSGPPTELEGEWTMLTGVFSGSALEQNMVAWCKRITRGDITTVVAGPQTMVKARFALDKSTSPHAIDYVNLHGGTKGKPQAGIYELSGDHLKICMSAPGQPRPKVFASTRGDGGSYTTWRLAVK